ncbi:uncharacterized protein DNG_09762 [Cephalotrichum gorgonifer]|uniref:F-box domain-containing protein n=1 Tax=Cephalotrichum gorgonifer TaxID=2041049 RepID=A0AAE8N830_9PEZI|nr:uncharacterized protein DNG_09762 [Cephalotrichum gorgonifer]
MLGTLIPDIFDQIIVHFELEDFYPIRLTSRRLERLSVRAFGAAAFSNLTVDFSADNLRLIRNVANHDEFRLVVHSLRVGEWEGKITKTKYSYQNSYGFNGHWPRLEDGRVDRECELVRQFVDSLSRLSNCTSVTFIGGRPLMGKPPYKGPEQNLSSVDALDLVLHALSVPGAPFLRYFQASIGRGLDWYPRGRITRAAVAAVENLLAGHLEEITLELDGSDGECAANLLRLATASRHLRKLRLWLCGGGGLATESRLTQHLDSVPRFTPALDTLRIRSPDDERGQSTSALVQIGRHANQAGPLSEALRRILDNRPRAPPSRPFPESPAVHDAYMQRRPRR